MESTTYDLYEQRDPSLASASLRAIDLLPFTCGMKKRPRKKKHVGEFQQLGFEIDGDLRPRMERADVDAFTDRFLAHMVARELAFGGGIGGTVGGFVTRFGRSSATEIDRASVAAFLASDPDVVRHVVGDLRDAWY